VRSDHEVLLILRERGVAPCHQLHYIQMATEKLGKAYYWRGGSPPPKTHASFVRFLQTLNNRNLADRQRIAKLLGFKSVEQFVGSIRAIAPLAHEIEKLAPALAGDKGPNPEYPWPGSAPAETPSKFDFPVWKELKTSVGRQLLKVIDHAIQEFPNYGP
jgi:hypothetical protein